MTKKTLAVITALFVALTLLPATVFAGDMALSPDGSGGFYLTMPEKGTGDASLDLSDKDSGFSFTLYDDGGKDNNYSDSYEASLIITAPENTYLRVSGNGNTESGYDYLTIYDGDTDTVLSGQHTGSFNVAARYTSGNVLKVFMFADSGLNSSGFALTVTVVDPASILKLSFDAGEGGGEMASFIGGQGDEITLPDCTFTLPENTFFDCYTDGENTYYPGDSFTLTKNVTLTALYVEKVIITYVSGEETADVGVPKGKSAALKEYSDLFEPPYRTAFLHWEKDGAGYNAGDEFTPSENVTFTAVFQKLPVLIDEGDQGCYALMPKKEDAELDLSDKENGFVFYVYDDGGKDGRYSSGCSGSLTITAPEGFEFMISGTLSCDYDDTLSIYDTDMTSLIGGYALSGYGLTVSEQYSAGNKIKLKFTSSDYTYGYDGFDLKITLVNPETLIKVSFDKGEGGYGSMADMGAIRGIAFTLPKCSFYSDYNKIFIGYSDGENIYNEGDEVILDGDTTFTALFAEKATVTYSYDYYSEQVDYAKGTKITLAEFTSMFSLPSRQLFDCWKAGDDEYKEGDEYTVNGDINFEAVLISKPVLVEDGEGGWYVNMDATEELTADISGKSVGFSFKVYDDGGKEANYSSRCSGYLNINAPVGTILKISGGGETESRYWDYLIFYDTDGATELGNGKYGGVFSIKDLTSSGNSVKIYFRSDSWTEKEGFELTVTVTEPSAVTYVFGDESTTEVFEKGSEVKISKFEKLFELPYGKEFVCWQSRADEYAEGDTYLASADITLTAVLAEMPRVTYDGGGATVLGGGETAAAPIPVNSGKENIFPHAKTFFEIPEGKVFGGWRKGDKIYAVGDTFSVTEDTTYTAVWLEPSPWDNLAKALNAEGGTDLGTIALTENIVGGTGSEMLYVPKGVSVTLDLAGHTADGTKVAPSDEHGVIILVAGSLTVTDTASGGKITGGGIRVLNGGALSWDGISDSFKASVESSYSLIDHEANARLDDTYCTTFYPTLKAALLASALPVTGYEESLETIPEHDNYMFSYNDEYVKMLADAAVPAGETWEINPASDDLRSIWFDLNGKTLEILGTLTGGTPGTRTVDGVEEEVIYPTDFHIVSTTPGTVKLSGTVNVSIQPWTQDTYYFTGGGFGENASFFADGGTYYISGGSYIPTMTFNNGNQNANLTINISGDAEFQKLQYVIYDYEGESPVCLTIEGDARINEMEYRIMGDGGGARPTLVLNGGYFAQNPMTHFSGYVPVAPEDVDQNNLEQYYVNRYGSMVSYAELEENEKTLFTDYYEVSETFRIDDGSVIISGDIEEYAGQADWAADGSIYKFRIGAPDPTALTLIASRSGNEVSYEIKNAPESFVLVAAQYDGNRMTDIQILKNPAVSGTINMQGTGKIKMFLRGSNILKPILKTKELK